MCRWETSTRTLCENAEWSESKLEFCKKLILQRMPGMLGHCILPPSRVDGYFSIIFGAPVRPTRLAFDIACLPSTRKTLFVTFAPQDFFFARCNVAWYSCPDTPFPEMMSICSCTYCYPDCRTRPTGILESWPVQISSSCSTVDYVRITTNGHTREIGK